MMFYLELSRPSIKHTHSLSTFYRLFSLDSFFFLDSFSLFRPSIDSFFFVHFMNPPRITLFLKLCHLEFISIKPVIHHSSFYLSPSCSISLPLSLTLCISLYSFTFSLAFFLLLPLSSFLFDISLFFLYIFTITFPSLIIICSLTNGILVHLSSHDMMRGGGVMDYPSISFMSCPVSNPPLSPLYLPTRPPTPKIHYDVSKLVLFFCSAF